MVVVAIVCGEDVFGRHSIKVNAKTDEMLRAAVDGEGGGGIDDAVVLVVFQEGVCDVAVDVPYFEEADVGAGEEEEAVADVVWHSGVGEFVLDAAREADEVVLLALS